MAYKSLARNSYRETRKGDPHFDSNLFDPRLPYGASRVRVWPKAASGASKFFGQKRQHGCRSPKKCFAVCVSRTTNPRTKKQTQKTVALPNSPPHNLHKFPWTGRPVGRPQTCSESCRNHGSAQATQSSPPPAYGIPADGLFGGHRRIGCLVVNAIPSVAANRPKMDGPNRWRTAGACCFFRSRKTPSPCSGIPFRRGSGETQTGKRDPSRGKQAAARTAETNQRNPGSQDVPIGGNEITPADSGPNAKPLTPSPSSAAASSLSSPPRRL